MDQLPAAFESGQKKQINDRLPTGLGRDTRNKARNLRKYAGVVVVLAVWCALSYGRVVDATRLPTPTALWDQFVSLATHGFHGVSLEDNILVSVEQTMLGLGFGIVFGVSFGLAMGYSKVIEELFGTLFSFIRPIPAIAFLPLAVLYLGIGLTPKVVLISVTSFLFIVMSTESGVRGIQHDLLRVAKNLGLNRYQTFRYIILPGATPGIMTGVRTGLALSWALIVAVELIAAQSGLGYMIEQAGNFFELKIVFIGIILIGIIGVILDSVVVLIERRLLHWQGR
jgi:NitT/TauT family transport system permease protein